MDLKLEFRKIFRPFNFYQVALREKRWLEWEIQDFLTLEEAVFYTGISAETLLEEAFLGTIAAGKFGDFLLFSKLSLQQHLSQYNLPVERNFRREIEGEEWLSSNDKVVRQFKKDYTLGYRDFEGINLIGANLSRLILVNTDLDKALLVNADLQGSDLSNSFLRDAYLISANLSNANLMDTDLEDADLSNANLSKANLEGANLSKANLTGVNLSGANLNRTSF